jgi:O-antigen/teichoic acid export membrane protein
VAKVSQIAVALILVRVLAEDEWAAMALLLSIYLAAISLGTLNLHQGVYFFFGRTPVHERRRLAAQTSGLLGASGLLTAAVVLAIAPLLTAGPYAIEGMLPWLALAVALEMPTVGGAQMLIASERPGMAAIYDACMAVLQVSCMSAPVLLGGGVGAAMIGLAGYAAVRLLVFTLLIARAFPGDRVRFDWALIKQQLVYTAPLSLAIGTSVLNRNLDKWIVAALDAAHFGAYAIAAQEVPLISIVPYAIGATLATRIVHAFKIGDRARARGYFHAQTTRMSLVVIPAAIALILVADELIVLLFTDIYAVAALPFQLYTVILLHRVAEYGLVLRAAGDTRSLWWSSLVLFLGNAALSAPLTLWLGMLGAALGALIANVLAWLFILSRVGRALGTGLRGVFPWRYYGLILAISITLAAALAAAVAPLALAPAAALAIKAGLFALAFLAVMRVGALHRRVPPLPPDDADFDADVDADAGAPGAG